MIERIATYWDGRSASWLKEEKKPGLVRRQSDGLSFLNRFGISYQELKFLKWELLLVISPNILNLAGFEVTAVDLSPQMINSAKQVSQDLQLNVDYSIMDAQHLQFEDNTFDLVFTRLMTWTIPDLEKCYREMERVLKPGGRLINLDADFGKIIFSADRHDQCPSGAIEEVNEIKSALEISQHERPAKDIDLLQTIGFGSVEIDVYAQNRILELPLTTEGLFMLEAIKK